MDVLMIVTEKLPVPPVRGGAIQTYVEAVSRHLSPHRLTIFGVTDPSLPDREKVDGVSYVRVPGGTLDLYAPHVIEYLLDHTFDLIHVFNRPRLIRPVREAAPRAKLVLSLHNEMFAEQKIVADEAKTAIKELSRIVTVSDYIGRTVSDPYPAAASKLQTIYSGVDAERFVPWWSGSRTERDALRREFGLVGKKVILFVGRLSPKKGADVLVRAMPLLAERHPDAALVLVGSKWYGEDKVSDFVAYVRALAARSPIPVVTTGFVNPDQVHKWFAVGDLFVCPSQWEEPLARVHYEAMAAGLPIVTTNRGGNPEVVQGAGNGVVMDDVEDPGAFADVLSRLLGNPDRLLEMGRRGRSLAERHYGWERVAREIGDVWASV